MVSLEQVKLLETKVVKAIDVVKRVSEENTALRGKLDGYRSRIDELEVLIKEFKADQGRIEAGILSALERLNQFEDAVERGISESVAIVEEKPLAEVKKEESIIEETPPENTLDPDSDEAILAALEAEEAKGRSEAVAEVESALETEPDQKNEEEPSAELGGELDIF